MKIHFTHGCRHVHGRTLKVQLKHLGAVEELTCKTCLKDVIKRALWQDGGPTIAHQAGKRLLEVRYLNKEPAVMRIAAKIASGEIHV